MQAVDIVLPTYLTSRATVEMTIRFAKSVYDHAPHATLVWVDNGSGPNANPVREWLAAQGRPFVDKPQWENLGFPKAVNIGLRASTAPYIVVANNDVEIHAGAVQTLQKVVSDEPACAVAAPISTSGWQYWANLERYLGTAGLHALTIREDYADRAAWLAAAYGSHSTTAVMVAFFFAMLPRWALDRVGLLDEGYGMGFAEDDDWCERARRMGFEVRLSLGAFVTHDHRATWRSFMSEDELTALQERNAERLARRKEEGFA